MKVILKGLLIISFFVTVSGLYAVDAKAGTLKCVGLYSETAAGTVSYRTGTGAWTAIKVGDVIPANAQIRINVERDWIELIQSTNPNAVYEIVGSEKGEVLKMVSEIIKTKPRTIKFPKKSANMDPEFKDKMVVASYLGRQRYKANASTQAKDIKYGDILDIKGNVNIIAINNTLSVMYPNGEIATVIGPLKFDVAKMFTKESLYKYLNVAK
jgi:hypothetical protein